MHLSNEEKLSILEESRDKDFQKDLKLLLSQSKNMSLQEYLDFLNLFPGTNFKAFEREAIFKKVIF